MKLWIISQEVNNDYDTYDSAIVAAPTAQRARWIHPSEYRKDWDGTVGSYSEWCDVHDVQVEYIGEAKEGTPEGVILASFNAG